MNAKILHIVDYISMLVKKYSEIQQAQMANTFRVASIKNTTSGTKVIVQVIGKSTFMECTPVEITANDVFLEKFSKKDVQKITYVHAREESSRVNNHALSDLKLISQQFNITNCKTNFILRDKDGNTALKTAKEIMLDKVLIKKLDPQEAINIGYIAGYEHSQHDYDN